MTNCSIADQFPRRNCASVCWSWKDSDAGTGDSEGDPSSPARPRDALVHRVVGKGKVVFEATGAASLRRGRRQIVENQVHRIPPSVQLAHFGRAADGDVES